jgi:hypothetical protein
MTTCRYGRKKSGACKKKPGPKRGRSSSRRKTRCPKGRVTRGPRKGRCRK